jgi:uncharacterized membrane protein YphA (DoxX/SURF4 family)
MNKIFSSKSVYPDEGITAIRIIIGLFLIYHGLELFDSTKLKEYTNWDVFKNNPHSSFMVHLGKAAEFIGGLQLVFGLFTRLACILIIGTMSYITFFVGNGKFWYEDQYPFLFAILALLIFFTGPGTKSLDYRIFDK